MTLMQLYDPCNGVMRVIGMMSGTGTNLEKIIEHEKKLDQDSGSPYKVVAIFTDNPLSNAERIGEKYKLPVVVRDIKKFYAEKGKPLSDMEIREEFDRSSINLLKRFNAPVAAYAGLMSVVTAPLIKEFLGVNIHPADLSIMEGAKRKYRGAHAVRDAILAGERHIRSTAHIIEPEVDAGKILIVSRPVEVILPEDFDKENKEQVKEVAKQNQYRLKEFGDWEIFPMALQDIALGFYSRDEQGNLYHMGKAIPNGYRLD